MKEIPPEVAQKQGIPEDLDSSVKGPYRIPNPRRRRMSGAVYLGGALLAAGAPLVGLPTSLLWVAAGLGLVSLYHWLAAWELAIGEGAALLTAGRQVEFAVGHASAALGFRGWRARPLWNVLVYSAERPPTRRGLVRVDAVSGAVIDTYEEDVPPPSE